jgi:hypothetical protein
MAGCVAHTWTVTTTQYEATLRAVACLDRAVMLLLSTDCPEPMEPGWTSELTNRVVEGMRACKWFLAAGFNPPDQFGSWLRNTLEEAGLGARHYPEVYGSAAWHAADAVDHLKEQWRPEWSMSASS